MSAILFFGLLLGMKHALEADHVAAVASLAGRDRGTGGIVRIGLAWGFGHTLTLLFVVSLVVVFNTSISEQLAHSLEMVVGVMLVLLGCDVLYRLFHDRIHFHIHKHRDEAHLHAHSHNQGESHDHGHNGTGVGRAFMVGLVHGLAGSAALIVLSVTVTGSGWTSVLYTIVFGFGSMLGMALLTLIIAVPLRFSARRLTWAHNGLLVVVGITTIIIGATLFINSGIRAGLIA